MSENKIKSVLVVGMNRSGTKGLSNELGYHEDIAMVGDDSHYGILITPVYEVMDAKFNLHLTEEYIGAISMLAETDFFKITGIEKGYFYNLKPRPKNYSDLFDELMSEYARRTGKTTWLQKTSPRGYWRNREDLSKTSIVVIKRDLISNIRSRLGSAIRLGRKSGKTKQLIRAIYLYVMEDKLISKICSSIPHLYVNFADFKIDTVNTRNRVFEYLKLDPTRYDDSRRFPRNTSFGGAVARDEVLSGKEILLIKTLALIFGILPAKLMYYIRERSMSRVTPIGPGAFNQVHRDYDV